MDDAVLYLRHSMAAALELAEPLAHKAVVLDSTDAGAYIALAYIHFGRGNLTASLAAAEQALELNPNCAGAYWSKSGNLVYLGRYAEAVEAATTYLRLSPRDLRNWRVLNHLTLGRYLTGDYVGAIEAANQALRLNPNQPLTSRWLAAALGQLGRMEEALRVIAQVGAVLAPVTFDSYALTRGKWLRPEAHAILLEGLRKAGWSPAAAASQSAEAQAG
jgi:adenylate cyclase